MAESIWDLAATVTADTRAADRALNETRQRVLSLADGFRGMDAGSKASLANLTRSVTGLQSQLSSVALGLGVAASATVGLASALFSLVKHAADAGGDLFDLAQKTNFSVESLSGLSILAESTGANLDTLSNSLVIFQRNMQAANDSTSKQAAIFRELHVTAQDSEQALRQAITSLSRVTEGSKQTALAMALFGRSGKDMMGIVKEVNGNLDQAMEKYRRMGLIISTDAAQASDQFNDTLTETSRQLSAVGRQIGTELLPIATESLQHLSKKLAENKDQWAEWGQRISNTLRGAQTVAQSEIGQMIGRLAELGVKLNIVVLGLKALNWIGDEGPAAPKSNARRIFEASDDIRRKDLAARLRDAGERVTGGRGGGRSTVDSVTAAIRQQQREIAEAASGSDRWQKVIDGLVSSLGAEGKVLTETQRLTLEANAATLRAIDVKKEQEKTFTSVREAVTKWLRSLIDARDGTDQYDLKLREFRESLHAVGQTFDADTEKLLSLNIMFARSSDYLANFDELVLALGNDLPEMAAAAEKAFDPFKLLSDVIRETNEEMAERAAALSVGQRLTDLLGPPPPIEDMAAFKRLRFRDEVEPQLRDLSRSISSMLSDATRTGFETGAKDGFHSILQGFENLMLEMAQRWITSAIFKLLSGVLGGGDSGASSIVSKLGKFGGGFASGGYLAPGQWGLAGEHGPEPIFGGRTGVSVIPASSGSRSNALGGGPVHVTVNVYPRDYQSFMSRDSERQVRRKVERMFTPIVVGG